MGPIGVPELLVIFVIALIVFGPKKLPELGRSLGKSMAEFKRASYELRNTLEEEVRIEERKEEQQKAASAASTAAPAAAAPPEVVAGSPVDSPDDVPATEGVAEASDQAASVASEAGASEPSGPTLAPAAAGETVARGHSGN